MTTSGSQAATTDLAPSVLARGGAVARLEPAAVVVGTACESEPLFEAERALLCAQPDRVVRGLGAALLATGARRGLLAVRADFPDALAAARRATRGTTVEVVALPPYYPLDELVPVEVGLPGARCLDVRALADLDDAVRGRPRGPRWLSIVGAVRRPRVAVVPLGTPIEDLIDSAEPTWVALAGALRGPALDRDQVVDAELPGLLVLPAGHALVRGRKTTLPVELARAKSACIDCRICTDACPHALAGAPLEPHLALRILLHPRSGPGPSVAAGTLSCTGCGLCDVVCPAHLHPRPAVRALAQALRAEGFLPETPAAPAPHPDRAGRRLALELLVERLDLSAYRRPGPLPVEPMA